MNDLPARLTPSDGRLPLTIGITGHRDVHGDDCARVEAAIAALFESVATAFPHTPIRLLSPLAEGADRIAARTFVSVRRKLAAASRWELVVPMPLPEDIFRTDFPETQGEFEELKAEVDFIFHLPIREGHARDAIAVQGPCRDLQYQDASHFVASHSDLLIAVWDGLDIDKRGGTSDTVRMRLSGHKLDRRQQHSPLVSVDAGIVYHIDVRRISSDAGSQPRSELLSQAQLATEADVLARLQQACGATETYNERLVRLLAPADVAASAGYLIADFGEVAGAATDYAFSRVLAIYACADALSIRFERSWSLYLACLYGLGFVTALALPTAIEGLFLPWSMFFYLATMAVAAGLFAFIRMRALEDLHLDSRALAELMRVQFYWLFAGIEDEGNLSNPDRTENRFRLHLPVTRVLLGQQEADLGWIAQHMRRLIVVDDARLPLATPAAAQAIVGAWIEGQMHYFEHSHARMEHRTRTLSAVAQFSMVTGLLSAVGAVLMTILKFSAPLLHHAFVICAAWLPIMAVVIESYSDKLGLEAQSKTKRRMATLYRSAFEKWRHAESQSPERARLVIELGREAVAESSAWLFFRRNKPMKMPT